MIHIHYVYKDFLKLHSMIMNITYYRVMTDGCRLMHLNSINKEYSEITYRKQMSGNIQAQYILKKRYSKIN